MRHRVGALGLCLLLASLPAAAEPSSEAKEKARSLFLEGSALARENRWSEALRRFHASVELQSHAITIYDIGFCERALGHPTRARKYFRRALTEDAANGSTQLTDDVRASITTYLLEIEDQVAIARLTIVPPSARISLDGAPLEMLAKDRALAGTRAPGPGAVIGTDFVTIELDAGPHEILAVADDGRSKVLHERFAPRAERDLTIELPAAPEAPPATVTVDAGGTRRIFGFIIAGTGVAAIGIGTYFGLEARSKNQSAAEACPDATRCPDDRAANFSHEAKTDANVATATWVIGLTAVASGALLVITGLPETRSNVTVGASPTSGSLGFATSF